MLSRKDSTQKYIRIKEQTQKKYDNNTKLHCESNSSNVMCCKYLLTTCTHGMPEWTLSKFTHTFYIAK